MGYFIHVTLDAVVTLVQPRLVLFKTRLRLVSQRALLCLMGSDGLFRTVQTPHL